MLQIERGGHMTRLFLRVLVSMFFVICFVASSLAQSASPKALVEDFVKAWNSHDKKAWGSLFTNDAIWVIVAEDRLEGRSNIVEDWEKAHTTWAKNTSIVQSAVEVRKVSRDAAVILFRAGFLDKQGKLIPDSNRAMLVVAMKQSDGWRITAGQLAHPSPKPS
jgi:uncharacterized protein (TIGR02246 family)